jgi:hypothetical protein
LTAEDPPSGGQAELHASYQDVLDVLQEFYTAIDLELIKEEINVVFDDWDTDNIAERRQLLSRLHDLLESLQEIRWKLEGCKEGGR